MSLLSRHCDLIPVHIQFNAFLWHLMWFTEAHVFYEVLTGVTSLKTWLFHRIITTVTPIKIKFAHPTSGSYCNQHTWLEANDEGAELITNSDLQSSWLNIYLSGHKCQTGKIYLWNFEVEMYRRLVHILHHNLQEHRDTTWKYFERDTWANRSWNVNLLTWCELMAELMWPKHLQRWQRAAKPCGALLSSCHVRLLWVLIWKVC